jgi:hypothetical protein
MGMTLSLLWGNADDYLPFRSRSRGNAAESTPIAQWDGDTPYFVSSAPAWVA